MSTKWRRLFLVIAFVVLIAFGIRIFFKRHSRTDDRPTAKRIVIAQVGDFFLYGCWLLQRTRVGRFDRNNRW